ncbi:MAG: InlB B-repeat-containing protein [Bacillus subtilis]|nr:InlB B-repeat-containing protein [Bacillus subtilis]
MVQPFGEELASVVNPVKYGYTFAGWYYDPDFETLFHGDRRCRRRMLVLYAKWTINVTTITFDTQGGSAVAAITQPFNTAVEQPSDPIRAGFTFRGLVPRRTRHGGVLHSGRCRRRTSRSLPDGLPTSIPSTSWETADRRSRTGKSCSASPSPRRPLRNGPVIHSPAGHADAGLTPAYTFTTMPSGDLRLYAKWD